MWDSGTLLSRRDHRERGSLSPFFRCVGSNREGPCLARGAAAKSPLGPFRASPERSPGPARKAGIEARAKIDKITLEYRYILDVTEFMSEMYRKAL